MSQNTAELKKVLTSGQRSATQLTQLSESVAKSIGALQTSFEKEQTRLTNAISAQLNALNEEVTTLAATREELAYKIEALSVERATITEQIQNEFRKAKAELEIRILEDRSSVLTELLKEQDRVSVPSVELHELRHRAEKAEQSLEEAVAYAVASAKTDAESQVNAAIEKIKSENSVANAAMTAELKQAHNTIDFLTTQIDDLKASLVEERNARVEIARHSQPIIQTNPSK